MQVFELDNPIVDVERTFPPISYPSVICAPHRQGFWRRDGCMQVFKPDNRIMDFKRPPPTISYSSAIWAPPRQGFWRRD
ncbi:hypothetical protein FRC08_009941, partial [Ceratobasidium sp. 394]